ncbi:hypothetical protein HPB52_018336 [Rhipicephalus sanguineus]|uniref:Uncharacterized protein n=1 Tax=Rhipicephalus sanguineus TaxID=34632 RepID=A0A9D4T4F2_RHISA|nr:hypothetical protein HPB52_018336 [Rhipicephalus sanguineus]
MVPFKENARERRGCGVVAKPVFRSTLRGRFAFVVSPNGATVAVPVRALVWPLRVFQGQAQLLRPGGSGTWFPPTGPRVEGGWCTEGEPNSTAPPKKLCRKKGAPDPLDRSLDQASGCYATDAFVGSLARHLSYETIGQCRFRLTTLYLDTFFVPTKEKAGADAQQRAASDSFMRQ